MEKSLPDILAASFAKIPQRDQPIHPIERNYNARSELPSDVYDYLGNVPYLRGSEDYIKLPKELLEKWFAHTHPTSKTRNKENVDATETSEDVGKNPADSSGDVKNYNEPNTKDDDDVIKSIKRPQINENLNKRGSELAVKQKLFGLIKNVKNSIDTKTAPIQIVHDAYKANRLYKIGYLVSNINRTQDSLTEFYKHIEKNVHSWDVLKTLNAYDQVKTADEFLSKALYILNFVGAPSARYKMNDIKPRDVGTQITRDSKDVHSSLAWSYYDDTL
ncbi:uncharacterized protein LOC106138072 [Amyelois transitella]|uniref:uncharacterized protein LOC106138072 n=1 Tax=Amyelois transitella TaxID=680683 RepID=UPI00298F63C9|nr:uncharacterized protein LOC106138072 [Amyelois transitella]